MDRLFVEKKPEFNSASGPLLHDLKTNLQLAGLESLRIVQRYDIEGLDESQLEEATRLILSEPQVDTTSTELPLREGEQWFAVEYLPGQFDQRADSAAQCVQILTQQQRPLIASAQVIILKGVVSESELDRVKQFTINTVDSRESPLEPAKSLALTTPPPPDVEVLTGFTQRDEGALDTLRRELGLAMSVDDLAFCRDYFRDEEHRDPTITELRMLDTYWSDHCRHTTFLTRIDEVSFDPGTAPIKESYQTYLDTRKTVYDGKERPVTLMDIALMGMKELRQSGELDNLEVSREINAASIVVPVDVDGSEEEWLVMFKNETHNHPTEIEPFGGAATCLGGAIRDPLSGRSYVYQAMRVTGAGDPRTPFENTLPGKLPQCKICQVAAQGYSSYDNQIGLPTGKVSEIYHPGYVAKRMEVGAVIAAAPRSNVFRGEPHPGDAILLIGGRTGRDGVGGATGSSKQHTDTALENSAEVQKGDAPTERKIQRLFRNPRFARRIKVCNDFGAGGVSVAIGEIADSLEIDLDQVPKKYDGLDGTELAISESQERMAILVDPSDIDFFIQEADKENLECTHVANVADHGRLRISWRGKAIVDLSRSFLDTNGVQGSSRVHVTTPHPESPLGRPIEPVNQVSSLKDKWSAVLSDLNSASQKGLGEMFDGSVGAGTVLWPFGGASQATPPDAMAAKIPILEGETDTCTLMSWGFNPRISSWSPYHGAIYAVTESVCRIISTGGRLADIRLTLQEYFEKLRDDPSRWGKPFSALLGAYHAQNALRLAAIGGKDSMSGSFNDLDVPPTLISFAVAPGKCSVTVSPEFKEAGSVVSLVTVPRDAHDRPDFAALRAIADQLHTLATEGALRAMHSLGEGGLASGLATMAAGNRIGFQSSENMEEDALFRERYASFLVESAQPLPLKESVQIGKTTSAGSITTGSNTLALSDLLDLWEGPLEDIYATKAESPHTALETFRHSGGPRVHPASSREHPTKPLAIIPAFPGTNSEYDSARSIREAGGKAEVLVFRNLSPEAVDESLQALATAIRRAQILFIPGGFSAGDEPDGSGKFIATVLRSPMVRDAVMELITRRDGLILGICNGFQALIKTGLVPFGEIRDPEPDAPTLTFNEIGRHVSCYVTTRIASNLSPWLSQCALDDLHLIPVSHGEGKFYASESQIRELAAKGQIATQYSSPEGEPSMRVEHNPNGSLFAVEGITSPCGRVLGKMGHTERSGPSIARNIPGDKHQPLFSGGVGYFAS